MRNLYPFLFLVATLVLTTPFQVNADDENASAWVVQLIPDAEKVGQGTLTYLVWDVYDATLFAPHAHYSPNHAFALVLDYKRDVAGKMIADSSASEIERQGFSDKEKLSAWHQKMTEIFQDVSPQTILTGLYIPGKPTCFFRNQSAIGCIDDPQFGPLFFNIWLGPKTREPGLRDALMGRS